MNNTDILAHFNVLPLDEQRSLVLALKAAYQRNADATLHRPATEQPVIHRLRCNGL